MKNTFFKIILIHCTTRFFIFEKTNYFHDPTNSFLHAVVAIREALKPRTDHFQNQN